MIDAILDSPSQAPELDIDPYADDVLGSPYAMHAAMREAGPVAFLPKYDMYVMGRHRDVHPAIKDWQTFPSNGASGVADLRKPGHQRPARASVEEIGRASGREREGT